MRTRRSSRARSVRWGQSLRAWLAIFSLLLQLFVTAGHFHPEDFAVFYRDGGGAVPGLAGQGGRREVVVPGTGGQPALPSHDDCAVCFSLQLVGSSAMPEPIVLAVPPNQDTALPSITAAPRRMLAPHSLAQTRAPPIA